MYVPVVPLEGNRIAVFVFPSSGPSTRSQNDDESEPLPMSTRSCIVNGVWSPLSGMEPFGVACGVLNRMMRSGRTPLAAAASRTVERTSGWTKKRQGFASLNWSSNSSAVNAGFVVLSAMLSPRIQVNRVTLTRPRRQGDVMPIQSLDNLRMNAGFKQTSSGLGVRHSPT